MNTINTMNDSGELVFVLQQKLTGTSAVEPYCVLSRELLLRVIAVLRDGEGPVDDGWLAKVEQGLTATEFRIYRALYRAQGRTLTPEALKKAVGRPNMSSDSLWVHTRRLRLKLSKWGWGRVETVRTSGYFLALPDQMSID